MYKVSQEFAIGNDHFANIASKRRISWDRDAVRGVRYKLMARSRQRPLPSAWNTHEMNGNCPINPAMVRRNFEKNNSFEYWSRKCPVYWPQPPSNKRTFLQTWIENCAKLKAQTFHYWNENKCEKAQPIILCNSLIRWKEKKEMKCKNKIIIINNFNVCLCFSSSSTSYTYLYAWSYINKALIPLWHETRRQYHHMSCLRLVACVLGLSCVQCTVWGG